MAVRANSKRLQSRLRNFARALPVAAGAALINSAGVVIERAQNNVRSRWSDNTQVGFDIERFIDIIGEVETLQNGGLGIFNVTKMGTLDDMEKIRGRPKFWHQGTRSGNRFGEFYLQTGWIFDQVQELADRRNQAWGSTEPQWWLLEHGTLGSGAFEPMPPNPAINTAIISSTPRVFSTVTDTVTRILRQRGVLV